MIKNVSEIKTKSLNYIKEFMQKCEVEEKIDAHYISVDIISKNEVRIKKCSGAAIDRVDLILNSMWSMPCLDWNYLKVSNKEWFDNHVGYTITMFYLPCATPILTKYRDGLRYIFDRVIYNGKAMDARETLEGLEFPKAYSVEYKKKLGKTADAADVIAKTTLENVEESFSAMVDKNGVLADGDPEGYIYKSGNKIYQLTGGMERRITAEKTSYEYMLCDFVRYAKSRSYADKITSGYVKTICNLFNDYIINWEKPSKTIEKNIDLENLKSPCLGPEFDIGYDYIPDPITKNLCAEKELYRNIFKILLANLRKGKDSKRSIYMNRKQVDDWNGIMKNIKIHTIYV